MFAHANPSVTRGTMACISEAWKRVNTSTLRSWRHVMLCAVHVSSQAWPSSPDTHCCTPCEVHVSIVASDTTSRRLAKDCAATADGSQKHCVALAAACSDVRPAGQGVHGLMPPAPQDPGSHVAVVAVASASICSNTSRTRLVALRRALCIAGRCTRFYMAPCPPLGIPGTQTHGPWGL